MIKLAITQAYSGQRNTVVPPLLDAWMSFPYLVIILSVMAILGPGLLNVILSLAVIATATNSRVIRGATLALIESQYIEAARATGCGHARIIIRHILPNVSHIVIIAIVMDFSGFVLAEAVLSYVGVGVDPSTVSFGTMINNARLEMAREPMVWWSLAAAFVFMLLMVLAANLFADAVRDAFDPRGRI